jgi:hypothetical protein
MSNKRKTSNVTLGADPECFIINEETGKVVSSIGIIPGEKGNPWRSKDMPKGYGIEIDNILAEFNIPPAKTKEDFVGSMEYMKQYLTNFVKKVNPNYGIRCAASELIDEDQLQSDEARLFGCSVDYNIYTGMPNPKPEGESTNLRSAGFHVHCGYNNPDVEQSLELLQYFDLFLGIPSVIKDTDQRRRTLYGKAGCFRLTEYGFEYRVLSSAMYATPELSGFVYDQCMKAIDAYNQGEIEFTEEFKDKIQTTINSGDSERAKEIVEQYNIF